MKNEYLNLWHEDRSGNKYGPAVYRNDACAVLEYRGVTVYKLHNQSFDYVFAGAAITQRAGFNADRAKGVIDGLLDETGHDWSSERVKAHIRLHMAVAA